MCPSAEMAFVSVEFWGLPGGCCQQEAPFGLTHSSPRNIWEGGKAPAGYGWWLLHCAEVDVGFLVRALPGPGQPWGRQVARWDTLIILLRAGQGGLQCWNARASRPGAG